jgi:hypothetical protein
LRTLAESYVHGLCKGVGKAGRQGWLSHDVSIDAAFSSRAIVDVTARRVLLRMQ